MEGGFGQKGGGGQLWSPSKMCSLASDNNVGFQNKDPLLSEVGGGAVYKSGEGDVTVIGYFDVGDVHSIKWINQNCYSNTSQDSATNFLYI